uniref:G2/M phase-specific E3 ubiquitin-protein ligase n=1 Tax=Pyxicephalus adspersus TaxID=30357 RepID=A0AAV2ZNJ7_PYXAD|nr:TPA: hypothetical protein GDO54_005105 [Pyxicephalus adspersus]
MSQPGIPPIDLPCMLCGRTENCIEKYGEKKTYPEHNLTLHYYCLLLSSGIWQRGEEHEGIYGFLVSDIKKELSRARRLRCYICRMLGASIGCVFPRCKRSYHYPCGLERQCIFQFMDSFRSYCWDHRPVQTFLGSEPSESSVCTICLEPVNHVPSYHVLRGPCCKTSWFHRDCLQYQALSAGLFFFRCTVCNNKELFQKEMLRMGINIPERDASWELEENAFQELLVRYQRCDVKKCKCQFGREYNESESKWEIVRCECCGSSGTHIACSSLRYVTQTWECSDCRRISCTPDILQELRSQIMNSKCTLRVNRKSLWKSSLSSFRKSTFSPCSTLHVTFTDDNQKASQQANVSLSQYFKLLLNDIENSDLFEGSARKNLSLNLNALQDNLYYEAGRMLAVALVHGGPAPGFLSQTLFSCLILDSHHVQPVLDDVADSNVLEAILTIQSCQRINKLKEATVRYFDYLQKTGTLHLVLNVSDKAILVKNMLSYHVIRRVQEPLESFKQGLQTLGVLEKIQTYPAAFWSILCMKPEKLTAKAMADLFTITHYADLDNIKFNAANLWKKYLQDTEDGTSAVSLEDILSFATGLDFIPAAGFEPQPSILFHYKQILPTARKNINCIEVSGLNSYRVFRKIMDKAICDALCKT